MATIVTGVALVMTGALALGAVRADDGAAERSNLSSQQDLVEEVRRLGNRVQDMEKTLNEYAEMCASTDGTKGSQ